VISGWVSYGKSRFLSHACSLILPPGCDSTDSLDVALQSWTSQPRESQINFYRLSYRDCAFCYSRRQCTKTIPNCFTSSPTPCSHLGLRAAVIVRTAFYSVAFILTTSFSWDVLSYTSTWLPTSPVLVLCSNISANITSLDQSL
jgi:hypothetical protein